ncbi:MAG: DUF58 domain-containing protein [Acidimicrobiia bacterium]
MLTPRGWGTLGAGLGSVTLWVAFGEVELLVLGSFLMLAALAAWASVALGRSGITVARRLAPAVLHEGQLATVEVALSAEGRRPLRNLAVEDEVPGLGAARFVAARLRPGVPVRARYEILCRRRGIYRVGPVSLTISDPFGLATRGGEVGPADRLVVYPAVEELEGLPSVRGRDPSQQAVRPQFSHRGGEDFFTLRDYQIGDDLRLVHWRSSAKRGELMIRQLEIPWQSRALVVLDPRRSAYGSLAPFEKAVQGTASVVRHLHRIGFSVGVWAAAPSGVHDGDRYQAAMETLATVQPVESLDLRATAARLARETGGGALVMVTGRPDADDLAAFLLLARDFGRLIVLSVADGEESLLEFQRAGAVTVCVSTDGSWAATWLRAVRSTWSIASAG